MPTTGTSSGDFWTNPISIEPQWGFMDEVPKMPTTGISSGDFWTNPKPRLLVLVGRYLLTYTGIIRIYKDLLTYFYSFMTHGESKLT